MLMTAGGWRCSEPSKIDACLVERMADVATLPALLGGNLYDVCRIFGLFLYADRLLVPPRGNK
jgi:hypothetical protein